MIRSIEESRMRDKRIPANILAFLTVAFTTLNSVVSFSQSNFLAFCKFSPLVILKAVCASGLDTTNGDHIYLGHGDACAIKRLLCQ